MLLPCSVFWVKYLVFFFVFFLGWFAYLQLLGGQTDNRISVNIRSILSYSVILSAISWPCKSSGPVYEIQSKQGSVSRFQKAVTNKVFCHLICKTSQKVTLDWIVLEEKIVRCQKEKKPVNIRQLLMWLKQGIQKLSKPLRCVFNTGWNYLGAMPD